MRGAIRTVIEQQMFEIIRDSDLLIIIRYKERQIDGLFSEPRMWKQFEKCTKTTLVYKIVEGL